MQKTQGEINKKKKIKLIKLYTAKALSKTDKSNLASVIE